MTNTADISKDLEGRRAARRAAARQAAAPVVAEIQAEQARRDALSPANRRHEDMERRLAGQRFGKIRDYILCTPTQTETGAWRYEIEYTTNGIDWLVGTLTFRNGQVHGINPQADPDFPWMTKTADR